VSDNQFSKWIDVDENAPAAGIDRLHEATGDASRAVAQLKSFDLAGHHGYMVAVNLQLVVLQERVAVFGDEEKLNIVETLQNKKTPPT